jgi:hypothetical protein
MAQRHYSRVEKNMSSLLSDAKNIFVGDENKIAKPIARFSPLEFNTPGLGVNMRDGGFTVNRTPQVGASLARLNNLSVNTAKEYGQLKDQLKPGFGALTTAGVNAIEDQRRSTVSNLRENLNRRRVLGSSFADDAISRTNAEFAKQDAQFRAETTLQEIEATEKLIAKQYETGIQGAVAIIDQGNFESKIGAELSRQFTSVMGDLAKYEATLLRDEADGQAALLSGLLGAGLTGGLGGVGGLLGSIGEGAKELGSGVMSTIGGFFGSSAGSAAAAKSAAPAVYGTPAFSGATPTAYPGYADLANIPLNPLATGVPGFAPNIPMTPLPATAAAPQATGALAGGEITSFNTAPPSYSPGSGVSGPAQAQFDPNSTIEITGGAEAATGGAEAAPSTLMQGPSGAAITSGGIAAAMALIRGDGFQQAIAQGGGAAAGASLGMAVGGPPGAIIGGIAGSMLGGKLGEKLGLSFSGGGDDKPDYSIGSGWNAKDGAIVSEGAWGNVGFGHHKHLTGTSRYQAALDAVTDVDDVIAAQLTPEENKKVKDALTNHSIARNSNEGGYHPGRLLAQVFNDRKEVLKRSLGPKRFADLGLEPIYTALASGDPQKIAAAFGGTA